MNTEGVFHMLRSISTGVASLGVASLLFTGLSQANAVDGDDDIAIQHLSQAAKNHGLTKAKGAYMGWKLADRSSGTANARVPETVEGIDVSAYQPNVDWDAQWGEGQRFAYIKATEGTSWTSNTFDSQYSGSYDKGFIRGAYHFAHPDDSSGATQAEYFVDNGGGWSGDGKTLPGVLDIEFNPAQGEDTCYGLSDSEMVSWIDDFTTTYKELTGRDAVIYTNGSWWEQCTGDSGAFSDSNPLWQAAYTTNAPEPAGDWGFWTIWQYTSDPIDTNKFNGSMDRLQALADG